MNKQKKQPTKDQTEFWHLVMKDIGKYLGKTVSQGGES